MFRFFVFALLAVASAEIVVDGPCPDVKAFENFKFSEIEGTWYEIAKFPNVGESGNKGKCSTAEYSVEGDKGKVKNSQVIDGVKSYVDGDLTLVAPGKVKITYKFGDYIKNSILTIVDIDYKNYIIGYSCKFLEKDNKHQVFSWILSRTKSLGESQAKVDAFLAGFPAIDKSNYVFNDFSEDTCKYTSTKAITTIRKKN